MENEFEIQLLDRLRDSSREVLLFPKPEYADEWLEIRFEAGVVSHRERHGSTSTAYFRLARVQNRSRRLGIVWLCKRFSTIPKHYLLPEAEKQVWVDDSFTSDHLHMGGVEMNVSDRQERGWFVVSFLAEGAVVPDDDTLRRGPDGELFLVAPGPHYIFRFDLAVCSGTRTSEII